MKTHQAPYLAVGVIVAFSLSAQAGGHSGHSAPSHASAPGAATAFHSAPGFRVGSGRMILPSQRFSAIGTRSIPTSPQLRNLRYANSRKSVSAGGRQFTPRTLRYARDFGMIGNNSKNRAVLTDHASRGLGDRNNHVFARRSANWHGDWNRGCDHWWHGHRCRFVNGCWFIFDFGFVPWYGWPYDYYAYDYYDPYSYGYDPGIYEGADPSYYGEGGYPSSDQSTDSVAAAQERLAREGYYQGEIDGVLGPETRRAIMRYQSDHGLRVTGYLTTETRQSLRFRRSARY